MSGPQLEASEELIREITAGGSRVISGALLSAYTTFRLGGPCPALVDCPNSDALRTTWACLMAADIPRMLIGGGSNLLVCDAGIDRVVVRHVEEGTSVSVDENVVTVSAGMNLDAFSAYTVKAGLEGAVYCSGIPGTVGGAIAGNAGAFGEQLGDRILSVTVLNAQGRIEERDADELGFAYRKSSLQETDDVILSAVLQMEAGDADSLEERRREILALRAGKHPDWKSIPTAGSFFKNVEPTSKAGRRQAAGWFLEEAGALSMRVGGARTFEKHANIIIGDAGCKAADVAALSEMMAAAVKEKFDLILHREVKLIGFDK